MLCFRLLYPTGTLPYGHYTLRVLYPTDTLPYGHYTLRALYPMGTLPYGHYTLQALYPTGTLPEGNCAANVHTEAQSPLPHTGATITCIYIIIYHILINYIIRVSANGYGYN